jgi:hypothetical protein
MKALNKTLESAGYTADMVTGEQSILTDALKYHVAIVSSRFPPPAR